MRGQSLGRRLRRSDPAQPGTVPPRCKRPGDVLAMKVSCCQAAADPGQSVVPLHLLALALAVRASSKQLGLVVISGLLTTNS